MDRHIVGGSFVLTVNGITYPSDIPFDVSEEKLELIIERLTGTGDVAVSYIETDTVRSWRITFQQYFGAPNQALDSYGYGNLPAILLNPVKLVKLATNGPVLTVVCNDAATTVNLGLVCSFSDSVAGSNTLGNMIRSSGVGGHSAVTMDVGSQGFYTYRIKNVPRDSAVPLGFGIRVYAINKEDRISIPTKTVYLKPMAVPVPPKYVEVVRAAGSDSALNVYWSFIPYPDDRAAPNQ